jgi:hypothetical protein
VLSGTSRGTTSAHSKGVIIISDVSSEAAYSPIDEIIWYSIIEEIVITTVAVRSGSRNNLHAPL